MGNGVEGLKFSNVVPQEIEYDIQTDDARMNFVAFIIFC